MVREKRARGLLIKLSILAIVVNAAMTNTGLVKFRIYPQLFNMSSLMGLEE